jgi:hypothetical protein
VVAELAGEKIDVIPWNDDPAVFVANALSPAQVLSVDIDEEKRIASVTVPERMLSLAIGREGQNARLAARLTGWRIDIRSDVSVAEARAAADAEPSAEAVTPTAVAETSTDGAAVDEAAPPETTASKPKRATKKAAAAAAEPGPAEEAAADGAPAAEADARPAKPKRTTKKVAAAETDGTEPLTGSPADAQPEAVAATEEVAT